LTGQSSTPRRCLLDRPVKPGDDSEANVNLNEKRSKSHSRRPGLACDLQRPAPIDALLRLRLTLVTSLRYHPIVNCGRCLARADRH
jgi:hypothetical protein